MIDSMDERIFICYAHENSRFAERLARRLQQRGLSVWLDQWHLAADDIPEKATEKALRESSHVLLILSPEAVSAWIVVHQFRLAQRLQKTIIPVLRRPCELPPPLAAVTPLDFTGWRLEPALRQLLSRYFPAHTPPDPMNRIKPYLELGRQWLRYRLWPWLWPGWGGPFLLLLCGMLGWIVSLRLEEADALTPVPIETLVVVQVAVETPEAIATPQNLRVRPIDDKEMVFVPAGEFLMGSAETDPSADEDEFPQRTVYLDAFWIDRTEVTHSEYLRCMEAGACEPYRRQGSRFETHVLQPIVGVDWFQAAAYCEWAGARLPTEAEWEKAARGPDGRLYPWGDQFEARRLNFCDVNCDADWRVRTASDGYGFTAPTGSFPTGASPYGALDMSGNVWEWTADWYQADYYQDASPRNPSGPEEGRQKVLRGGSWLFAGGSLRVTERHRDTPHYGYHNNGFRCAMAGE